MKLFSGFFSFAVAAVLIATAPAFAQDAATAMKQRTAIMKSNNNEIKELRSAAKAGKAGPQELANVSKMLADAKKLPALFPAGTGSDKHKNRAKPEIWKDTKTFEADLNKYVAALTEAEKAAKAGDAASFSKAVSAVDGACTTCHKAFRGARPK